MSSSWKSQAVLDVTKHLIVGEEEIKQKSPTLESVVDVGIVDEERSSSSSVFSYIGA